MDPDGLSFIYSPYDGSKTSFQSKLTYTRKKSKNKPKNPERGKENCSILKATATVC
jgi:hypothetical protein